MRCEDRPNPRAWNWTHLLQKIWWWFNSAGCFLWFWSGNNSTPGHQPFFYFDKLLKICSQIHSFDFHLDPVAHLSLPKKEQTVPHGFCHVPREMPNTVEKVHLLRLHAFISSFKSSCIPYWAIYLGHINAVLIEYSCVINKHEFMLPLTA